MIPYPPRRHPFIIPLIAIGCLFAAASAHAAVIDVSSGTISIDTQGQSVNAIELHLSFDPGRIAITRVSDGGSIVDFWIEPPSVSNASHTIDLAGIIPGGLETSNGKIASFTAVPAGSGGGAVSFSLVSAKVLLNDGKGTPAAVTVVSAPFVLHAQTSSPPVPDTTPPDPFIPQIGRDPAIFGDAWFVAFSTTDPQSGINHYEIMEGSHTVWHVAVSPYRLSDQSLSSNIYIRAVDNAGNFRVVELPAAHPRTGTAASDQIVLFITACVILWIGIFAIVWMWTRRKH